MLLQFLFSRSGASAAEYALILAVMCSAVVIGIMAVSDGFENQMLKSQTAIEKDYQS